MSKARWFLPTHTENLEMFLTSGLVTCVSGFNGAYVTDVMTDYPKGYVPFFSKDNLYSALKKSQEDSENLTRCIVELDASSIINHTVYAKIECNNEVVQDSMYVKLSLDELKDEGEFSTILIPSPLPLQCIKSVIFENAEIKNNVLKSIQLKLGKLPEKFFINDAKLFNVEKIAVSFTGMNCIVNEQREVIELSDRDVPYVKIFSMGGMLALMFYQSKNSILSADCFLKCCDLEIISEHSNSEFRLINNYFFDAYYDDEYTQLYSNILDIVSGINGKVGESKWAIINFLESKNELEAGLKTFAFKMAERLRGLEERLIDITPKEAFSKLSEFYSKNPSKNKILMILSMYFFRDNIQTMLKFHHPNFKDVDYVLFAMFYGVSFKYIGLPEVIKNINGLNFYVSNRMAEYAQRIDGKKEDAFKKCTHPKFLFNDLIKKSSSGKLDNFVDWFSNYLKLDSSNFRKWEIRHKGFSCDSNSALWFKEKPKLTCLIDIEELEQQMIISTISNEVDLFDFNLVYSQYEKLVK